MVDLIERYKITANLPSVMMNYCNRFNSKQIELITEMIYELENSIESVDAQPVKHGKWIIADDVEHFIAVCSECGRTEDSRDIKDMPYCHCGAEMRFE